MKNSLDCTIIMLSYNSLKVTDTALNKIESAVKKCQEVLKNKVIVTVVDNGSKDGSADMIRKKHPSVKLTALKENIGYSKGNNLAMKKATTPYILLMNSDTYIKPDSILKSLQKMTEWQDCDILVSRVVYDNGELQRYSGYLPTPLKVALWSFGFESLPIISRFMHRIYGHNQEVYEQEGTIEWYSPNFMLIKRKVYEVTKGFDPKLWFHMVDVEWCKRFQQKGLTIRYTPTIQVTHLGGASSQGIQEKLLLDNFKGLFYYLKKHYPTEAKQTWFFVKIGLKLRSFLYSVLGKSNLAYTYSIVSNQI